MISKTYEWYRLVSPTPNPQAVDARTKAAKELIDGMPAKDQNAMLAVVQGVARGFDQNAAEAETIEWLLRTLKIHDSAISEDLSENQLELRFAAAITLGELFHVSREDANEQATFAASALLSAMNIRPLPKERYLRAVLEQLSRSAFDVVQSAADDKRLRLPAKPLEEEQLAITDLATAERAIVALQQQVRDLTDNAIADREEINLFWFIATGYSRTRKEPFASLPSNVAAVHAALEMHRFLVFPAPLSCRDILASSVERKRKSEECKAAPLKKQVESWSFDEWNTIAGDESKDVSLCSKFPAIFPLIWVANRMRGGKALPNWTEFKKLTHLRGDQEISAAQLAFQLLLEKSAVSQMES